MKNKVTQRISNVFMELIILVLFLEVASLIIFRVYATTIVMSSEKTVKNNAIICSNSIMELYKSGKSAKECLEEVLPEDVKIEKVDESYVASMATNLKEKSNKVHLIVSNREQKQDSGKIDIITLKYLYYDDEVYYIEGTRYNEK